MLHKDALTLLNPVAAVVEPLDHELDGAALDAVEAAGAILLEEFYPSGSTSLLAEWEALFGLVPAPGALLADRRLQVVSWLRYRSDIKKPHFIALAASLGYTIIINDYAEPVIGFFSIGDTIQYEPWLEFNAGVSLAGDYLAQEDTIFPWIWEVVIQAVPAVIPSPTLEELIADLKPAHMLIHFTYL